jgi:cytochrome b involved in lipid metabolism
MMLISLLLIFTPICTHSVPLPAQNQVFFPFPTNGQRVTTGQGKNQVSMPGIFGGMNQKGDPTTDNSNTDSGRIMIGGTDIFSGTGGKSQQKSDSTQKNQTSSTSSYNGPKTFTMAQIAASKDLLTVLYQNVYNFTAYVHPGGADTIQRLKGVDGTTAFMTQHGSSDFRNILANYIIGNLSFSSTSNQNNDNTDTQDGTYSISDVQNNQWTIISGKVYDLKPFENRHGGGSGSIRSLAGIDGTARLAQAHGSGRMDSRLQAYYKGDLAPSSATSSENSSVGNDETTSYSMSDVQSNQWTVINGKVYDLKPFENRHEGGSGSIRSLAGTDGTTRLNQAHGSGRMESRLQAYYKGDLN